MHTFRSFLSEAGDNAERQEQGFVDSINSAVNRNGGKPVTLITTTSTIKNVIGAVKYNGRSASGAEPYTDVTIKLKGGKQFNVSMKGPQAPSLAGGGLSGIEVIIPGIGKRFFKGVLKNHLKHGLKPGSKVPDTFGKLNDADKLLLVLGTKAMGGPIDYMYIGPMTVTADYSVDGSVTVDGHLIDATEYAETHDLYFRLRARRDDQTFDPVSTYSDGTPKIYGKSPTKGDSAGRLVVTDRPSTGGMLISI